MIWPWVSRRRITVSRFLVQYAEKIPQPLTGVCGIELLHIIMEHALPAKDRCVLGVKAEDDTDAELVQGFQCLLILRIFVLLQEGIIKLTNKLTGLQGDLHLVGNFLDLFVHEEIQHVIFCREIGQCYLDRIGLYSVAVIDPDLLEIGCDDPAGTLTEGQIVIIVFGLLIRRHAVVSGLRFIKCDAQRSLFDQDMGLRDIDINSFCVAVAANNFLFKIHAFCHAVKPEDVGQDLDPVGAGILILAALAVPSIEKLAGSFPLL